MHLSLATSMLKKTMNLEMSSSLPSDWAGTEAYQRQSMLEITGDGVARVRTEFFKPDEHVLHLGADPTTNLEEDDCMFAIMLLGKVAQLARKVYVARLNVYTMTRNVDLGLGLTYGRGDELAFARTARSCIAEASQTGG